MTFEVFFYQRHKIMENCNKEQDNSQDRLIVSGSLNAAGDGLTTFAEDCFNSANIGANIGPFTQEATPFTFEGPVEKFKAVQADSSRNSY
jgi:hypothetical protein